MIKKLTKEQENLIPTYRDKWLKIGLSTERVNPIAAKGIMDYYYKNMVGKNPVPTVVMSSPLMAWNTAYLISLIENQTLSQVKDRIDNQILTQIWKQVSNQTEYNIKDQIISQIKDPVDNQILIQIRDQVLVQIWEQVLCSICDQINAKALNPVMEQILMRIKEPLWRQVKNQVFDRAWSQVWNYISNSTKGQVKDQIRDSVWDYIMDKIWDTVEDQVLNQTADQIEDQIEDQIKDQTWNLIGVQDLGKTQAQVCDQILNQVNTRIRMQIRDQVNSKTLDQIKNQIFNQIWAQIRANLKDRITFRDRNQPIDFPFIWPYITGHFNSGYFAFYDYFSEVCNIDLLKEYNWYQSTSALGVVYPLDNVCVVSDRPTLIKMVDGKLHCDGAAAIEYSDGFSVYSLNGVRVTKEIAVTPWDKLDSKLLITEENAEVRREIVRKVGIEKICKDLNAKKIDASGGYELLMLDIGDNTKRPYLKMINPSVGCYHIEGVPRECDTIEKALNSRKPKEMKKIPIDNVNGEDWYQQGDVCIWPQKAKSLKSNPKILT